MKTIKTISNDNGKCRFHLLLLLIAGSISVLSLGSCASMYVSSSEAHNRILPWTKLPEKEEGTEHGIAAFAQAATSDLYLYALSPASYDNPPSYLDYFIMGGISTWLSGKMSADSGWSTNLSASGFYNQVQVNTYDLVANNSAYGASIQADALLIRNYRGFFGQHYRGSFGPSIVWSIERGEWHDTRSNLPIASSPSDLASESSDTLYNMSPSGQSLSLGLHSEYAYMMSKDMELAYGISLHYTLHDVTLIAPFINSVSNLNQFYVLSSFYGTYSFTQFMAFRTNTAQYWLQATLPYNFYLTGNSSKFSLAVGTLFKL